MPSTSNREKAVAVLKSLQSRDKSIALKHISGQTYIQHNLGAPDGRDGFLGLFEIPGVQFKVSVVRVLEEGDYVATHSVYDFFGPKTGFDIFRVENGKIAEHWDVMETIPAKSEWKNSNGKY